MIRSRHPPVSPSHSLFGDDDQVLFDDTSGKVTYSPTFAPREIADAWFEQLHVDTPWRTQRLPMYDRVVDVPRLTASYALDEAPPLLTEIARLVVAANATPYTHVGLNLYRDGSDSVAPHNDHLDELAVDRPIALVSLGAMREMIIRAKAPPRRVLKLALEPGSLLLMSYATQLHYDHGIPKWDSLVGPRISLAFRVRKPATLGGRHYR
jgi:alkylated DNA repair dioxygenase AlkB